MCRCSGATGQPFYRNGMLAMVPFISLPTHLVPPVLRADRQETLQRVRHNVALPRLHRPHPEDTAGETGEQGFANTT